MATSPAHLTMYVRLADRFGDNGLISVFAAHIDGRELWIDLWLMSCRVFNRGVEQLLCNSMVERACERGCTRIHGVYLPTAKNGIVKGHYEAMGFEAAGTRDGGDHWTLDLERYRAFEPAIEVVDDYRPLGGTDAGPESNGEAR
jgi:predicted enzyme involved in methoxymalonyl-ACP biosynthesis